MSRSARAILVVAWCAGCSFSLPANSFGSADGSAGFDPATCPQTYDVMLASTPGSRYRIITAGASFRAHHAMCKADASSHLMAIETELERTQLGATLAMVLTPPDNGRYYVGGVQQPNSSAPDVNWSWLTGGTIESSLWVTGQPNDASGGALGEANEENLTVLDHLTGDKILDINGTTGWGAVCECDGKAIDPAIEAQIP